MMRFQIFLIFVVGISSCHGTSWKCLAAGAGAGAVAVGAAPFVLSGAGFTAGGIGAGSIAAFIQSVVYGGATTVPFSTVTSVAMTAIPFGANIAVFIVAGTTVYVVCTYYFEGKCWAKREAGTTVLVPAEYVLTFRGASIDSGMDVKSAVYGKRMTGLAAGSVAAGIQSAVYGGAASGAFSALTSAGMAGISTAGYVATGAVGGAAGYLTCD